MGEGGLCEELESLEDVDQQLVSAARVVIAKWLRAHGYGPQDLEAMLRGVLGEASSALLSLVSMPLREASEAIARCEDMGVDVPTHVKHLVAEFSEDVYRKLARIRGTHDALTGVRWELVEGPEGSMYARVHVETLSGLFTFSAGPEELDRLSRELARLAEMLRERGGG